MGRELSMGKALEELCVPLVLDAHDGDVALKEEEESLTCQDPCLKVLKLEPFHKGLVHLKSSTMVASYFKQCYFYLHRLITSDQFCIAAHAKILYLQMFTEK